MDRLGAPYDVTSVMHVPRRSWSRNGRNTIESRAGAHVVLGQQRGLSVVDKQQLNQLYNCGGNKGRTLFYVSNACSNPLKLNIVVLRKPISLQLDET